MNEFSYDPIVDSAYLQFSSEQIDLTIERQCNIDLDKDGYIVGIEILDAASPLTIIRGVQK